MRWGGESLLDVVAPTPEKMRKAPEDASMQPIFPLPKVFRKWNETSHTNITIGNF